MAKPFLRWAGSKRKTLSILSSYWNGNYGRYVEPFAGSACLFFAVSPRKALLADINAELIFTYIQVRDNLPAVMRTLRTYQKGKTQYLVLRKINPFELSDAGRAARFIYLNRYAFNGIYRTNQEGIFNVPYGGWLAGEMPTSQVFSTCSKLLKNAKLTAGSFQDILSQTEEGDFVYLDPPYSVSNRRVFRQYDPASFGSGDVELLRKWLIRLDKRSVKFLVSYAECREGRYLANNFTCRKIAVRRNIAGFTASRRRSYELLISN